MDAEKFDKVVLDLLYDELDELTRASAIRHMEQSARAKALYAELRATREVGSLPIVEPPSDLAANILAAEERARKGRPLAARIGTMVSILAGYTMRPQLGMAALLLLMLGSSLLLLRVKPVDPSNVLVTERGVPESDREAVAIVPVPKPQAARDRAGESPGAVPGPPPEPRAEVARQKEASAGPVAAGRRERAAAAAPEPKAGLGDLASSASEGAGAAAAPVAGADDDAPSDSTAPPDCERLETFAMTLAGSAGNDAIWSAAECHARAGHTEKARELYRALLGEAAYAERARSAILALPVAVAAKKSARPATASPPAAASPARAAPAKPGATAAPSSP